MQMRKLVIVFAALTLPALTIAQAPLTSPAPGKLVDVAGHKLHVLCAGPATATPTVVLDAGGGGSSAAWAQVQLLLAGTVRTCAYDRAGLGWSEPGPLPRTMRQQVFELQELLRAARIRGQYVMVGQSIGGLLVREFQRDYPDEVAGMVLVDPTHESAVLYSLALGRWVRLRELAKGRRVPEPRRDMTPSGAPDANIDYDPEEFQLTYLARLKDPQPLGQRPLIVLGAGKRPAPPGTADSLWARLRAERDSQVKDLAGLSQNSRFVLDPTSGHGIQNDNPVLVVRAIQDVIRAVSQRTRLSP